MYIMKQNWRSNSRQHGTASNMRNSEIQHAPVTLYQYIVFPDYSCPYFSLHKPKINAMDHSKQARGKERAGSGSRLGISRVKEERYYPARPLH